MHQTDNFFILDNENRIIFSKPFFVKDKLNVIEKVLQENNKKNLLTNLAKNYSYEGGFTLPLTEEWTKCIVNQNPDYSDLLKYHNCRDFRFVEDIDKIIGIRCKDMLRYWTVEEKIGLQNLIEKILLEHKFDTKFLSA